MCDRDIGNEFSTMEYDDFENKMYPKLLECLRKNGDEYDITMYEDLKGDGEKEPVGTITTRGAMQLKLKKEETEQLKIQSQVQVELEKEKTEQLNIHDNGRFRTR